jgi:hypothetical protein
VKVPPMKKETKNQTHEVVIKELSEIKPDPVLCDNETLTNEV